MAVKKNFTKADGAIDKLFLPYQPPEETVLEEPKIIENLDITELSKHTKHTNVLYDTNVMYVLSETDIGSTIKPKNKSKHYDKRGKRSERLGLLLDEQLKQDLICLSKTSGNRSLNDLIVTVLLDYVEDEENRKLIEQYKEFAK